jgi:O-antigen/teichoic acid export membrane protein
VTSSGSDELAAKAASAIASAETGKLVARNTLILTVSQALTVPLSILTNVVVARYLGPNAFGLSYLAFTVCAFGFLIVSWGHDGVLPAVVARNHSQSGLMLGSSVAFRAALVIPVYAVMAVGCHLFGYHSDLQLILALTTLHQLLTAFVAAGKDTVRGLERMRVPAYAHVGQQLLVAAFVIPVVMLGGQLPAAVLAQGAACAVILVYVCLALRPAGVNKLSVSWSATRTLFYGGTPFVVSGLVMSLQPMIDAMFLSKLTSADVIGWYAVARRLVGVLLFPASALIGALYPTLCRLFESDRPLFAETTSAALRNVSLVVVPVMLGCALYADVAIAMFNRQAFGPTADDLRILSVFIALVYFSMPLGTCVLAAQKQRAWSVVQSLCLVGSVALDPLLVPWFQRRFGNGGLGVCLSSTLSEVAVVICGIVLTPRGVFDRKFFRVFLLSLVAGAALVAVSRLLVSFSPYIGGPLALMAYIATLWFTGAIEKDKIEALRQAVMRRFARARGNA